MPEVTFAFDGSNVGYEDGSQGFQVACQWCIFILYIAHNEAIKLDTLTSHSSLRGGVSLWWSRAPLKCQTLKLERNNRSASLSWSLSYHQPIPSLNRGAVVAVTTCAPSAHHSRCVESLACKQRTLLLVTTRRYWIRREMPHAEKEKKLKSLRKVS